MFLECSHRTLEQQPPFVQKGHVRRKTLDLIQFVRRDKDGHFSGLVKKPGDDLVACQCIEPAEWLIENQKFRTVRQCASERHLQPHTM